MFEKINIYFVMMFLLAIFAVEKAVSLFEWYSSYLAILEWLFIFGVAKFLKEEREKREEK